MDTLGSRPALQGWFFSVSQRNLQAQVRFWQVLAASQGQSSRERYVDLQSGGVGSGGVLQGIHLSKSIYIRGETIKTYAGCQELDKWAQ